MYCRWKIFAGRKPVHWSMWHGTDLMVNDDVYNHVKAEDVEEILAKYE